MAMSLKRKDGRMQETIIMKTPAKEVLRVIMSSSSDSDEESLDCGLSEIVIGFQGMNDSLFTEKLF